MSPALSVVIPTHNRREALARTLAALTRQTAASVDYEVLVVADGCQDGTAEAVRALRLPCAVRVIEQPASGAAAARNRGAAAAAAPVVLFLDDDMEADAQLIAAHMAAHRARPGRVVLGAFRPSLLGQSDRWPVVLVNLWWAERFAEMARPEHRFSCFDLYTGNVSLPRALFSAVGGFEEGFQGRAGEDYELGIRLLKRGAVFQFVAEASSVHHDHPTASRALQRAFAEGRGHALIVSKHPELFAALPLRFALHEPLPLGLRGWLRPGSWAGAALDPVLRLGLSAADALRLKRVWQGLHALLHSRAYWQGVLQEVGSWSALERLVQELPLAPEAAAEVELDLAEGLPQLDARLAAARADALRLRWGPAAVGYLPSVPGAEPLRGPHVRHVLTHWFGFPLLTALRPIELEALTRSGPPGLHREVQAFAAPASP